MWLVLPALVLAAGLSEGGVRWLKPTPRVQIVRASEEVHLREIDGVHVWRVDGASPPPGPDCAGDTRRRITVVGDSVMVVSSSLGDDYGARTSELLEQRLGGDFCVANVAVAGFYGEQQLAVLKEALAVSRPELVIWQIWKPDGRVRRYGDTLIDTENFDLDARGYPHLPLWPTWPWLFRASRAYELLVMTVGARERAIVPEGFRTTLAAVARIRAAGAVPLVVVATPLDQPFVQSIGIGPFVEIIGRLRADGVEVVELAEVLAGDDVEALRLDTCCHFHERGHVRIAESLEPIVRRLLAEREGAGAGRVNR